MNYEALRIEAGISKGSVQDEYHTILKWASISGLQYGCLRDVIDHRSEAAKVFLRSASTSEEKQMCIEIMVNCNSQINKHLNLIF